MNEKRYIDKIKSLFQSCKNYELAYNTMEEAYRIAMNAYEDSIKDKKISIILFFVLGVAIGLILGVALRFLYLP